MNDARNDSLATTVVLELERTHKVKGVLYVNTASLFTHVGSVLHGRPASRNLGGVTLDESGEDGVGKRELDEVLGDILLHLVSLEASRSGKGLLVDDGGGSCLVGDGRDVAVGDDTDLVPFTTVLDDLIGNGGGLCESGNVLADLVERDLEVFTVLPGELSLGLVTEDGDGSRLLLDGSANGLGDGRVDTTAKTTVGRNTDVENLGLLGSLGLGLSEELC